MSDDMIPVRLDDPMRFECASENPCFNECCRDLNQALTPYDILRMKTAKGKDSKFFLREYTSLHFGPESGLPIVTFKPNPATGHACPFVKEDGCGVYEDRPASCRMYPLARAIARSRETGEVAEFFALIEEDHCKGFGKGDGRTIAQWLQGQKVDRHNQENDKLMELISLKNQIRPGSIAGAESDIFYTALYDLDTFRDQIFAEGLLGDLDVGEKIIGAIKTDDLALLNFGIAWVKYKLFGQDFKVDM